MRQALAACRVLLSEFKLGLQTWPLIIGTVMSALNEALLNWLGKRKDDTFRTPLEVMPGLKPNRKEMDILRFEYGASKK